MTVSEPSLQAFKEKKPELNNDQEEVKEALEEIGPAIGEEIAQHLGRPYHTISGRPGELEQKGEIKQVGTKENPRGIDCKLWKVKQ